MHADSPAHNPLVIIKVGGSLLDLADLKERLTRLINQRSNSRFVLIGGGGAAADIVRIWGDSFSLCETACHALALKSMHLTASLLEKILPGSRVVSTMSAAMTCWTRGAWPILDVAAWLNESESNRAGLPESWAVTSDSLSAWVADHWQADELWLLKSTDLPAGISCTAASQTRLVDAFFPQIAPQVQAVSWCNLRAEVPELQAWPQ